MRNTTMLPEKIFAAVKAFQRTAALKEALTVDLFTAIGAPADAVGLAARRGTGKPVFVPQHRRPTSATILGSDELDAVTYTFKSGREITCSIESKILLAGPGFTCYADSTPGIFPVLTENGQDEILRCEPAGKRTLIGLRSTQAHAVCANGLWFLTCPLHKDSCAPGAHRLVSTAARCAIAPLWRRSITGFCPPRLHGRVFHWRNEQCQFPVSRQHATTPKARMLKAKYTGFWRPRGSLPAAPLSDGVVLRPRSRDRRCKVALRFSAPSQDSLRTVATHSVVLSTAMFCAFALHLYGRKESRVSSNNLLEGLRQNGRGPGRQQVLSSMIWRPAIAKSINHGRTCFA